ncbi:MAG: hypothetical protein A2X59_11700 [Nitrospirae bacterium GWC2_42_7]|nr:MAG: hypothetical protein A2X59_11700 [Nitrospirae bacterium GWC2_42_7]
MKKSKTLKLVIMAALAILITGQTAFSAEKPTIAPQCKQCHQPAKDVIRGTLVGISENFKTVQVATGKLVWVINYSDDLKLSGAEKISGIPKEKEVAVAFVEKDKVPYAVSLSVKPPATVPPEKIVSTDELLKLIASGPEKGGYVLLDSRPAPRYMEGHLPQAVSMPFDKFDSLKDTLLPADKEKLLIFYCGGVT